MKAVSEPGHFCPVGCLLDTSSGKSIEGFKADRPPYQVLANVRDVGYQILALLCISGLRLEVVD